MNEAQKQFLAELEASQRGSAPAPQAPTERGFGEEMLRNVGGQAEMAGMLLTGAIADPLSKVADIASTPFVGVERGTEIGKDVAGALTYMPQTERGQEFAQATGEFFEPVGEFFKGVGQTVKGGVQSATGSEMAGEMTKDILSLAPDILAVGGAAALRGGIRLKTPDGQPTPELKEILNRRGLNYDALTPEAKASIPDSLPPAVLQGMQKGRAAKDVARTDIEAGGRQAGLADVEVTPSGRLRGDRAAQEAIRQGWDEGFIQAIKTANPATQSEMLKMLNIYEQFKADKSIRMRPSDIAGQAVTQRLTFIKDAVDRANALKNRIAREKFPGMTVDYAPVTKVLMDELDRLGVQMTPGAQRPNLNFRGSDLQADTAAQGVIKKAVDLMATGGAPDAARLHRLKLQLDNLVDYSRTSGKLTKSGQDVVKAVRAKINDQLRTLDPEYARANDVVSTGINIFDDLRSSAGTKVDIFADTADKAIGQQLRRLFSNTQARVNLENTVKAIDDFSNQLTRGLGKEVGLYTGDAATAVPKFNTDAYDLALFANNLDRKFGTVAETSLQGVQEAANIAASAARGDTVGFAQQALGAVRGGIDRARGVDEFSAYRALEDVIRQGVNRND